MALWVTYDNLSVIVGPEAAFRLAAARGGLDIWIPERFDKTHELALVMGLHGAKKLCDAFGGSEIVVPSRRKRMSRVREVNDLLEKGERAAEIALKLGITVRYVRYLAAQAKTRQQRYSMTP